MREHGTKSWARRGAHRGKVAPGCSHCTAQLLSVPTEAGAQVLANGHGHLGVRCSPVQLLHVAVTSQASRRARYGRTSYGCCCSRRVSSPIETSLPISFWHHQSRRKSCGSPDSPQWSRPHSTKESVPPDSTQRRATILQRQGDADLNRAVLGALGVKVLIQTKAHCFSVD